MRGKKFPINEPAYELGQITISVPSKYIMVTLAVDIFYVNTIQLIFSILKHIGFGTTQPIDNGKVETLENALETVVNLYQIILFQVTLALMDNQF